MKQVLYSFLFVIIFFAGKAQIYQPISFPEKIDKKYDFNSLKELEKYQAKVKKSIPKRYLEDFAYTMVYGKTQMFTNGDVYMSWDAMETYVNKILDSIMPSELTSKKIRAYIGRSSSINAFCLYDGTMIVNVGLLAEVKNEAALAQIMGHELGHFKKNHILNGFKNALKNKKGSRKSDLELDLKNKKHSQDNETEADGIGFDIAKSAKYDLNEGISNYEMFIREQEYYATRTKSTLANTDSVTITTSAGKYKANTLEKLMSSHPDMKERKDKLLAYIKSNPQTKKVKFKINETQFMALQAQARLECITLIFSDHDYSECLERAFLYYLSNPDEISYSYYAAESIRRLCLFDFRLKKKGFLTEKLTNNGFKEGQGILHDLKFMVPNPDAYNAIKAKDLVSSGPTYAFETYKEAFYYFTKKVIDKGSPEGYLSRALFENNKGKIKDNIGSYLRDTKAKHKDFANAYLAGNVDTRVTGNKTELVMIPRIDFYSEAAINRSFPSGIGPTYYYFKKSEILGSEMADDFAANMNSKLEGVKAVSMPQLTRESFNTKFKYESVLKATLLASRDENEGYEVVHFYKELEDEDYVGKVDIFRMDPEIWEFFVKNDLNSITFAKFSRHRSRAAKKLCVIYGVFVPFTLGFTGILIAGTAINYKKLDMYSFSPTLGAMYYDYYLKGRKIRSKKATEMYRLTKEMRDEYVKEYNSKYGSEKK
jgi:hypothetical protein